MFFKVLSLYTIANISSLLFVTYFFTGFKISQSDGGYFILLALVLAVINYFLDPIIKFFTLKIKFLTIWLFAFLLYLPLLYLAKLFVTGIDIKDGVFRSISFGNVQFTSFSMNEIVVIVLVSIILGFGAAFVRWCME